MNQMDIQKHLIKKIIFKIKYIHYNIILKTFNKHFIKNHWHQIFMSN